MVLAIAMLLPVALFVVLFGMERVERWISEPPSTERHRPARDEPALVPSAAAAEVLPLSDAAASRR